MTCGKAGLLTLRELLGCEESIPVLIPALESRRLRGVAHRPPLGRTGGLPLGTVLGKFLGGDDAVVV